MGASSDQSSITLDPGHIGTAVDIPTRWFTMRYRLGGQRERELGPQLIHLLPWGCPCQP